MSIYVYLCPETAKMIAQICEDRKKHKQVITHDGDGRRPTFVGTIVGTIPIWPKANLRRPADLCGYHYGWILLDFSSRLRIFGHLGRLWT